MCIWKKAYFTPNFSFIKRGGRGRSENELYEVSDLQWASPASSRGVRENDAGQEEEVTFQTGTRRAQGKTVRAKKKKIFSGLGQEERKVVLNLDLYYKKNIFGESNKPSPKNKAAEGQGERD